MRLRAAFFGLFLIPAGAAAKTIQVGPARACVSPSALLAGAAGCAALAGGDVVEIDAGVYAINGPAHTTSAAYWGWDGVTIRGMGGKARLVSSGDIANQKGIWILGGNDITIEDVEFIGAAISGGDGDNAAGIRAEGGGALTLRRCLFRDNENGILGPYAGELLIEYCEFDHNGLGEAGRTHNMYIGDGTQKFTLRHSYTHRARIGHNVKSRARENHILYNRISDEADGNASYSVDLPDGGRAYVIGNVIHKGPLSQNSVIAFAAEHDINGTLEIYVVNNTFHNQRSQNILQLRSGTTAVVRNNIFYGPGARPVNGGLLTVDHNYSATALTNESRFVDPNAYDYHLELDSPAIGAGVSPGVMGGVDTSPAWHYVHPTGREVRPVQGALDAGAFEFVADTPSNRPRRFRRE
jgi:hypothetical protein